MFIWVVAFWNLNLGSFEGRSPKDLMLEVLEDSCKFLRQSLGIVNILICLRIVQIFDKLVKYYVRVKFLALPVLRFLGFDVFIHVLVCIINTVLQILRLYKRNGHIHSVFIGCAEGFTFQRWIVIFVIQLVVPHQGLNKARVLFPVARGVTHHASIPTFVRGLEQI